MEAPSALHVPSSFDVLHKENVEKIDDDEALSVRHREKKGETHFVVAYLVLVNLDFHQQL